MQARRGALIDALGDGGLVAEIHDRAVGLLCWRLDDSVSGSQRRSAEVTCLAVDESAQRIGVGRKLLDHAEADMRGRGVTRLWLVTTNDNLAALALYQKAGYRLSELRPGAVDEARRGIKPSIPELADSGIPIRDELELLKDI